MSQDTIDLPSTAILRVEDPALSADVIAIRREPSLVLAEARKAALALVEVINSKKHKVMFNDEQYIENEDWQTIARFYGLTAKTESDTYCQYGEARGFEATAVVIDVDGVVRSRATAMCLNDEANWSTRPRYDVAYILKTGERVVEEPANVFQSCVLEPTGRTRPNGDPVMRPKKERILVGEEPVPLFQLRSMAQTRAQSKAFSMILRFVPVLAGMKATPAEELPQSQRVLTHQSDGSTDGQGEHGVATGAPEPSGRDASATTQPTPERRRVPGKKITEPQRKRLFAIAKECSVAHDTIKQYCVAQLGIAESTDILMDDYEALVDWVRAQKPHELGD